MVLGGGPLEGHEDGLHMNRISGFIKETPATLSRLSYMKLLREDDHP